MACAFLVSGLAYKNGITIIIIIMHVYSYNNVQRATVTMKGTKVLTLGAGACISPSSRGFTGYLYASVGSITHE